MKINYAKELNKEQLEAVKTTEGPVLILAVAGSGKTRTLVYRVAYLIESGVDPESILLLTFTNKAADEMRERASKMLDDRCSKITACTYHSFCALMLRKYAKQAGLPYNYGVLSSSDAEEVIKIVKDELGISQRNFPKVKSILSVISESVNKNKSLRSLILNRLDMVLFLDDILKIAKGYAEYKREHGLLDFDDMLTRFVDLLQRHPEVAESISHHYRYIMVDEYQDSNRLQEEILFLLRKDNHNLAVVGDDMQSLYAFRGAEVSNIIDFPEKVLDCRTITLNRNYRSGQEILDFSNDIVRNHATEGIVKPMIGCRMSGRKPKIVYASSQFQEAKYVADKIVKLHNRRKNPLKYSDIAVLERSSMSSNMLESMLMTAGVPFVKYGGLKFMDREFVRDVVALWKILVNEKDEISWYRVLQLFYGISTVFAQRISTKAGYFGAEILTTHDYRRRAFAKDLSEFREIFRSWKDTSYPDVLQSTIDWYQQQREKTIDLMRNKSPMEKLALKRLLQDDINQLGVFNDIAGDYKNIADFVTNVTLESPELSKGNDDNLVISTIHSAKGLEFPAVFVLDCADGCFPRSDQEGTREDQEELRCMYVAVTRAKDWLYIMVPEEIRVRGCFAPAPPSHFLRGAEESSDQILLRCEFDSGGQLEIG